MAKGKISVAALRHKDKRRNIPTAELEPVMDEADKRPKPLRYPRNTDLDPQLVWRGKDEQDWSDLIVQAPPLYIQEKIHPEVLVDDLLRQSRERREEANPPMPDLFADFNGLPDREARTEFYQHDANWSNRMILGDSLSVMASLAEREGLRGKVQCIYIDPPYGIRFNSNFQWSTTTRDVKDGSRDHITREPEQVKAFRDTWRDGIHSYLTYLRDRLTVARDLLTDGGSIFIQIGDENVHRVRAIMDEVFGEENAVDLLLVKKKGSQKGQFPEAVNDYIVWHCKDRAKAKTRQLFEAYADESQIADNFRLVKLPSGEDTSIAEIVRQEGNQLYKVKPLILEKERTARLFTSENATAGGFRKNQSMLFEYRGRTFDPGIRKGNCWKHTAVEGGNELSGMRRLAVADRLYVGQNQLRLRRYFSDLGLQPVSNWWDGFGGAPDQIYVVQTNERVVERCLLLTTDPGDLVLDPTCGSGTTAYVAEQWGRRWITIDTSRVALALARARIMGARYAYYLLADSPAGQRKHAEITGAAPKDTPTHNDIRQGFVYERRAHITSAVVANNAEIDVIWERWQEVLEPLRKRLNATLGRAAPHPGPLPASGEREGPAKREGEGQSSAGAKPWEEWEIPREAAASWSAEASKLHADWWAARIARQKEIDASISAKAEFEYLYDKPYTDTSRIRVAGPFTVESLSPHRVLAVDADDSLIDQLAEDGSEWGDPSTGSGPDFAQMVLENFKTAGVRRRTRKTASPSRRWRRGRAS